LKNDEGIDDEIMLPLLILLELWSFEVISGLVVTFKNVLGMDVYGLILLWLLFMLRVKNYEGYWLFGESVLSVQYAVFLRSCRGVTERLYGAIKDDIYDEKRFGILLLLVWEVDVVKLWVGSLKWLEEYDDRS